MRTEGLQVETRKFSGKEHLVCRGQWFSLPKEVEDFKSRFDSVIKHLIISKTEPVQVGDKVLCNDRSIDKPIYSIRTARRIHQNKVILTEENKNTGYDPDYSFKILALPENLLPNKYASSAVDGDEIFVECEYVGYVQDKPHTSEFFKGEHYIKLTKNYVTLFPVKKYDVDEDFYKHTGFYTHEEMASYEKGRAHEESVIVKWVENWDGSVNSAMGDLLMKKFKSINPEETWDDVKIRFHKKTGKDCDEDVYDFVDWLMGEYVLLLK